MEISIQNNIKEVTRGLNKMQRKQIPFATSQALNDVAKNLARKQMPIEMQATFQGGATGHTKRAFLYDRSNKRNLRARVFTNPRTHEYMSYMVHGGQRLPKRRAIFIPSRSVKRNKHGNVTRSRMQKMITDRSKFFTKNDKKYEKFGRGGSKTRLVGVYKSSAMYRPVLPLEKIARSYVYSASVGFTPRFRERLTKALATAR
tara:strand:- start:81 stop:686 length:606 start_codon:yes stop_codon:yes gene_type:complete